MLAAYGFAGLPVVDESGVLLGMLSGGDVLRAGSVAEDTARAAMTTPALTVDITSHIDEIGRLLVGRGGFAASRSSTARAACWASSAAATCCDST